MIQSVFFVRPEVLAQYLHSTCTGFSVGMESEGSSGLMVVRTADARRSAVSRMATPFCRRRWGWIFLRGQLFLFGKRPA